VLTFFGQKQRNCDGGSRRHFLKVGALSVGGLSMADLLRADALAGPSHRPKSVINIFLGGGPSHLDTFDLKPDAPTEIRGQYHPIPTNVPGFEICELLPRLANIADNYAVIRSIHGMRDEHRPEQSDSGWSTESLRNVGGRPGVGAVVSRLLGPSKPSVLANVALPTSGNNPSFAPDFGSAGFLGPIHAPYRPDGPGRDNLRLNQGVSVNRLQNRRELLTGFDRMRRDIDSQGRMEAFDSFTDRSMSVITSGDMARALDLSQEDPRAIDRYGITNERRRGENNRFLLARRLVEAGVRCVSFTWGHWDTHGNNFRQLDTDLPALDDGLASMLEDLDSRGLLKDTIVMMSGEFGRTPRINKDAGRDHWARSNFFFLAGGGLRTGQVIGSTNRWAEEPLDRPIHLQQVFAAVYRQLGIDPDLTTLIDPNGRPQYLADAREPIRELL